MSWQEVSTGLRLDIKIVTVLFVLESAIACHYISVIDTANMSITDSVVEKVEDGLGVSEKPRKLPVFTSRLLLVDLREVLLMLLSLH